MRPLPDRPASWSWIESASGEGGTAVRIVGSGDGGTGGVSPSGVPAGAWFRGSEISNGLVDSAADSSFLRKSEESVSMIRNSPGSDPASAGGGGMNTSSSALSCGPRAGISPVYSRNESFSSLSSSREDRASRVSLPGPGSSSTEGGDSSIPPSGNKGLSKAVSTSARGAGGGSSCDSTGSGAKGSCSLSTGGGVTPSTGEGPRSVSRSRGRMLSMAASTSSRGGPGAFGSGSRRTALRSKSSLPTGGDGLADGISLFMTMIVSPHFRQRMRAPFPLILDSSNLKRARQAWHSMIIVAPPSSFPGYAPTRL